MMNFKFINLFESRSGKYHLCALDENTNIFLLRTHLPLLNSTIIHSNNTSYYVLMYLGKNNEIIEQDFSKLKTYEVDEFNFAKSKALVEIAKIKYIYKRDLSFKMGVYSNNKNNKTLFIKNKRLIDNENINLKQPKENLNYLFFNYIRLDSSIHTSSKLYNRMYEDSKNGVYNFRDYTALKYIYGKNKNLKLDHIENILVKFNYYFTELGVENLQSKFKTNNQNYNDLDIK